MLSLFSPNLPTTLQKDIITPGSHMRKIRLKAVTVNALYPCTGNTPVAERAGFIRNAHLGKLWGVLVRQHEK